MEEVESSDDSSDVVTDQDNVKSSPSTKRGADEKYQQGGNKKTKTDEEDHANVEEEESERVESREESEKESVDCPIFLSSMDVGEDATFLMDCVLGRTHHEECIESLKGSIISKNIENNTRQIIEKKIPVCRTPLLKT